MEPGTWNSFPNHPAFVWIFLKKSTRYHLSSGKAASICHCPSTEAASCRHRLCQRRESLALQRHESLEHLSTNRRVSLRGCTHPKQSPGFNMSHLHRPYPQPTEHRTLITDHYAPFFLLSFESIMLQVVFFRTIPLLAPYLNRGSNQPLHPPSPFLAPVQTPGFLSKISCFPFTQSCLDIIEPRFEQRTARGRFLSPAGTVCLTPPFPKSSFLRVLRV